MKNGKQRAPHPTAAPPPPPPNARAFAKRKSAQKGAFIVDARIINWYSTPPWWQQQTQAYPRYIPVSCAQM